jgi:hypothetical protein
MDGSAQARHGPATQTNVAHSAAIINAVQGSDQYVSAAPPAGAVQRPAEAADRLPGGPFDHQPYGLLSRLGVLAVVRAAWLSLGVGHEVADSTDVGNVPQDRG